MKGLAGTNIPKEEGLQIIRQVRDLYKNLNPFIKPFVPPLPDILKKIPPVARKYTVDDLVQLLEWAAEEGLLNSA